MATKRTAKKSTASAPRKKPVKRSDVVAACDRINKLRDALYKKMKGRWSNSYGHDQFDAAMKHLTMAAYELNNMY